MSKQSEETKINAKKRRFSLLEWSQIISGIGTCVAAFCALYAANKANMISERAEFASERNSCIGDLVKSTDSLKDGLYGLIKVLARSVIQERDFDPQTSLEKASEVGALLDQFDADLRKHGCKQELNFSEGLATDLAGLNRELKASAQDAIRLEPLVDRLNELGAKKIYRTCCPSSL
jgi:hypothetical protein